MQVYIAGNSCNICRLEEVNFRRNMATVDIRMSKYQE